MMGPFALDEPLASLDPQAGCAIELIHQIHVEQKKTVIIIEHRLEDVLHRLWIESFL